MPARLLAPILGAFATVALILALGSEPDGPARPHYSLKDASALQARAKSMNVERGATAKPIKQEMPKFKTFAVRKNTGGARQTRVRGRLQVQHFDSADGESTRQFMIQRKDRPSVVLDVGSTYTGPTPKQSPAGLSKVSTAAVERMSELGGAEIVAKGIDGPDGRFVVTTIGAAGGGGGNVTLGNYGQYFVPGQQRVAVIIIRRADDNAYLSSPELAEEAVFTGNRSTSAFYSENSSQTSWLTGKNGNVDGDVYGPYTYDVDPEESLCVATQGIPGSATYAGKAKAAQLDGFQESDYDYVQFVFPTSCGHGGGVGEVSGRESIVYSPSDVESFAYVSSHELGHNFGLWHSNAAQCKDHGTVVPVSSSCTNVEYGDRWDNMGSGGMSTNNGPQKARLDFIDQANVSDVTTFQQYSIAPSETRLAAGNPQVLRFARTTSGHDPDLTHYYFDYRQVHGTFDTFPWALINGTTGLSVRLGPATIASMGQQFPVANEMANSSRTVTTHIVNTGVRDISTTDPTSGLEQMPLRVGHTFVDPDTGNSFKAVSVSASNAVVDYAQKPSDPLLPTVSVANGTLTFDSSNGTQHDSITIAHANGAYVISDWEIALNPGSGCATTSAITVTCPDSAISAIALSTGDGDDSVLVDPTVPLGVSVDLGSGSDFASGAAGADVFSGGPGADILRGYEGGDTLSGGTGLDTIHGGNGSDVISGGLDGENDALLGELGTDTISYADASSAVSVDLALNVVQAGDADLISGFESAVGGSGADTLTGSLEANVLDGGSGNDALDGGSGNDTLNGGEGDDSIASIDELADAVDCGAGIDSANVDTFDTPVGCESVVVGQTTVKIVGATLVIGLGSSSPHSLAVDDLGSSLMVSDSEFPVKASGGCTQNTANSVLCDSYSFTSIDVTGGPLADTITLGSSFPATVHAGAGDDNITAGSGADSIFGEDGNDTIYARDEAPDQIDCGSGADSVDIDPFDPAATGCESTTVGGVTKAVIQYGTDLGGNDADVLDLSTTNTAMNVVLSANATDYLITDNTHDVLASYGCMQVSRRAARCPFTYGNGQILMNGGTGADTVLVDLRATDYSLATLSGHDGADTVTGGDGTDRVLGSNDNDVLNGGLGNDTITGGSGDDTIVGGSGTDSSSYSDHSTGVTAAIGVSSGNGSSGESDNISSDIETLIGGTAADVLTGSAGANTLSGGSGNDLLNGGLGNDNLLGGASVDTVTYADRTGVITANPGTVADDGELGAGEADTVRTDVENITGGNNNDVLSGSTAANKLVGNGGNDTLSGGAGNDTLDGGPGTDTLNGEDNDDSINAIDGASGDNVNCGNGTDTTASDVGDTLNSCETNTGVPDTILDSGPADGTVTNAAFVSFVFHSSIPGGAVQCIQGGQVVADPCGGAWNSGGNEGTTVYSIRAVDQFGNVDPTPVTRTVTFDYTAPDTVIDRGPAASSTIDELAPTFIARSTEANSTLQCSVDGAAYATCTSPYATPTLALGSHTVGIRAVDAAGNVDGSPATRTFTVAFPQLLHKSTPATISGSPNLTTDNSGAGLGASLDWVHWKSTTLTTIDRKNVGTPLINALTKNGSGSVTTASGANTYTWTDAVGTASGSSAVGVRTGGTNNTSGFRLSLPAVNTQTRTLRLWVGVLGTNSSGKLSVAFGTQTPITDTTVTVNSSSTPVNRAFTINYRSASATDTLNIDWNQNTGNSNTRVIVYAAAVYPAPQPNTTITSGPAEGSTVATSTAQFGFSSTISGSTFQCSFNWAAFATCTSPFTTPTLTTGSHVFKVRAVSPSGFADQTPAVRTFKK